jgi:hypothetical protein
MPWRVVVRVFNELLQEVKQSTFSGQGSIESPFRLGSFSLDFEETYTTPLLTVVEVITNGLLTDRTFYWTNYETQKGCLFTLPKTALKLETNGNQVTVTNTGAIPAVSVNISQPGHLDTFTIEDNYFWLNAGESKTVGVNTTEGLNVSAWNVD